MSLTKTDQVEEARGSLDQGIQELRGREPDYATDPTRNGWHDLLICQFLAAEATALVKQAEASQDTPDQLRRQAASSDSLSGEGE